MQSFAVICRREDCLLSFVGDEEVRMVDNKELESGLKAMAGRDRGTARATLGEGLSVSAFPRYARVEGWRGTSRFHPPP
jgi:hypothetical protein